MGLKKERVNCRDPCACWTLDGFILILVKRVNCRDPCVCWTQDGFILILVKRVNCRDPCACWTLDGFKLILVKRVNCRQDYRDFVPVVNPMLSLFQIDLRLPYLVSGFIFSLTVNYTPLFPVWRLNEIICPTTRFVVFKHLHPPLNDGLDNTQLLFIEQICRLPPSSVFLTWLLSGPGQES